MDLVSKGYCQRSSGLLNQYLNTTIVHLINLYMLFDVYKVQLWRLSQQWRNFLLNSSLEK